MRQVDSCYYDEIISISTSMNEISQDQESSDSSHDRSDHIDAVLGDSPPPHPVGHITRDSSYDQVQDPTLDIQEDAHTNESNQRSLMNSRETHASLTRRRSFSSNPHDSTSSSPSSPHLSFSSPNPIETSSIQDEFNQLLTFIKDYTIVDLELESSLKPFIPDYIPCIGDIDPFIKIQRPDLKPDTLGLVCVDEPSCDNASDPSVLDFKLRSVLKSTAQPTLVRYCDTRQDLEKWIQNIKDLHHEKPHTRVNYKHAMPDLDPLMQAWPSSLEKQVQQEYSIGDLSLDLKTSCKLVCSLLDIPVYEYPLENKKSTMKSYRHQGGTSTAYIESLHVLFSLYSEFKNSVHFQRHNQQHTTHVLQQVASAAEIH